MRDIIVNPVPSAGLIDDDPPKQVKPAAQEKRIAPFSQTSLVKKPAIPTRPLVRKKITGLFSRYLEVKKPISRPTVDLIFHIEAELAKVGSAWTRYQSTNSRDAVYIYLEAVYALVRRWRDLNCAVKNSRLALRLQHNAPQMQPEPFGIVIFCTSDPEAADAKTRSKWSRVLRYARKNKPGNQRLTDFVKSRGGLNECARRFARQSKD
ncbi:MAG: hypothetical protein P4L50_00885 [Anaerolineaceae bacterium]|nr:hypothetical protein [Anaerolineaceae bacterium]